MGFWGFLDKNFQYILPFISVVIGGFISYISTSKLEKIKNRKQIQREKLESILIPYCTCIEKIIDEDKKIYLSDRHPDKVKQVNVDELYEELEKPIEYLQAAKRVYLSKESRKKLDEYSKIVESFERNLDEECERCITEYKKYLEKMLYDFQEGHWESIDIKIADNVDYRVKSAIIFKSEISLIDYISTVIFNNDIKTRIKLTEKTERNCEEIDCGKRDINNLDVYDRRSVELKKFIDKNEEEEKIKLKDIIDNVSKNNKKNMFKSTRSDNLILEQLEEIYRKLNKIKEELLIEIDKITQS